MTVESEETLRLRKIGKLKTGDYSRRYISSARVSSMNTFHFLEWYMVLALVACLLSILVSGSSKLSLPSWI